MMKLFVLLTLSSIAYSADEFYRIVVQEPNQQSGSYMYMGRVDGGMPIIEQKMKSGELVHMVDLRAWSGDKMILWVDYDKTAKGDVYINPKFITSVMPLRSDPLGDVDKGDKKALF